MKDSFVFHSDFIVDLPEEYKARFAMYAINYGLSGEAPSLDGLELTIWLKIQRRIDSDQASWEEAKSARSEAGKLGGKKSAQNRSKIKQIEANEAPLQNDEANEAPLNLLEANEAKLNLLPENEASSSNVKQAQANEAVYVNGNVNVSKSISVSSDVNVYGDSEESATTITQKIIDIQNKYKLNLSQNQINTISASLKTSNLDSSFLDYVENYLLETYHKVEAALFYKAAVSWDNLRDSYNPHKPKKLKSAIPEFEICPDCREKLSWIDHNARFCRTCRKNFVYKANKWSAV